MKDEQLVVLQRYHQEILEQFDQSLATKDGYIFDIVDTLFSYGDFMLFPTIAHLLGAQDYQYKTCLTIGKLSQLIYLSSKIHFDVYESNLNEEGYRRGVQFPILVGDLLYGRFFECVTEPEYQKYLNGYIDFLTKFNGVVVDYLQNKCERDVVIEMLYGQLAQLTADYVLDVISQNHEQNHAIASLIYNIGCFLGAEQMNGTPAVSQEAILAQIQQLGASRSVNELQSMLTTAFLALIKTRVDTFDQLKGMLQGNG